MFGAVCYGRISLTLNSLEYSRIRGGEVRLNTHDRQMDGFPTAPIALASIR
jgi:hypothetical protein